MQKPQLHIGSVKLRTLHQGDLKILTQLANDKRIWDNLRDYFPHPYKLEDAERFVELTSNEDPTVTFAIAVDGNFAGIIGITEQKDVYRRSAEIGYWLGAPYWGKGIATKAVMLITDYAFNMLNYHRLHTGVFSYNLASMRVLEKCGFQPEGIFRQAVWKNHKFWDEHRYALIRRA